VQHQELEHGSPKGNEVYEKHIEHTHQHIYMYNCVDACDVHAVLLNDDMHSQQCIYMWLCECMVSHTALPIDTMYLRTQQCYNLACNALQRSTSAVTMRFQ
jgi:hypothetical protein